MFKTKAKFKKPKIKVKYTCVPDSQKLESAFGFLADDFQKRFEFIKKNNDSTNKTTSK